MFDNDLLSKQTTPAEQPLPVWISDRKPNPWTKPFGAMPRVVFREESELGYSSATLPPKELMAWLLGWAIVADSLRKVWYRKF